MMNLERLNSWTKREAKSALLRCCGASRWAEELADRRPFLSEQELFDVAERIWQGLDRDGWLEAFAAHPKIGDLNALRAKFPLVPKLEFGNEGGRAAWSAGEQAGLADAEDAVLQALARGNRLYEEKFGYIFIICATGKTAGEMLALLEERMKNDPDKELSIAAGEQTKITQLRLRKLCS